MYVLKKKTTVRKKRIQNGELKVYVAGGQRDILYSIEQIQGNTGTDFKIEYSKKHLYTEHLSSAYYILVSKIAC